MSKYRGRGREIVEVFEVTGYLRTNLCDHQQHTDASVLTVRFLGCIVLDSVWHENITVS